MKLGVQMYTVREYAKTLEDFEETLKKIADIGYKSVQVSGTCAYEGDWLAEKLKENGLTADSTHYNYNEILHNTEEVIKKHKLFNCKYIGIGAMPDEGSNYEEFKEFVPNAAKTMKDNGAYLIYHNHAFDYKRIVDGKPMLHDMAERFSPDILGLTLDCYWITAGGYDAVEEIHRFAGRIPCVHYKDMNEDRKRFAVIGEGILDMEKITEAYIECGAQFAFVEQDDCYGENPFDCLKRSYKYLRSLGVKD